MNGKDVFWRTLDLLVRLALILGLSVGVGFVAQDWYNSEMEEANPEWNVSGSEVEGINSTSCQVIQKSEFSTVHKCCDSSMVAEICQPVQVSSQ